MSEYLSDTWPSDDVAEAPDPYAARKRLICDVANLVLLNIEDSPLVMSARDIEWELPTSGIRPSKFAVTERSRQLQAAAVLAHAARGEVGRAIAQGQIGEDILRGNAVRNAAISAGNHMPHLLGSSYSQREIAQAVFNADTRHAPELDPVRTAVNGMMAAYLRDNPGW